MYIHNQRHEVRLNEVLELKYYCVDVADQQEPLDILRKKMELKIEAEAVLNLEEKLKTEISRKILLKIESVKEQIPEINHILELLNDRIDVIQNFLLELHKLEIDRCTNYQKLTSLSRSGIGFDTMELVGLNGLVFLVITLFPSKMRLMPFAKVAACEKNQHKPGYYLQLQFIDFPGDQQSQLEKHIDTRLDELLHAKKNN